jgi:signal transduction histidine kinase/DNA-binding response OmpR family regulator/ligand-binding sensor domain-containing protein
MKGSIERALEFFQRMRLEILFSHEKRFLFLVLLLFGFFWGTPSNGHCQVDGYKYLRNFSPKEYDSYSQNWSILQDKRGIIYVANRGCLLEFDGISWRKIRVHNSSVRSLAMDDRGTIYVGGDNEIGYLAPDEKGSFQCVSLVDYIDENRRNFSTIWKILAEKEEIYFWSLKFIFRWNPIKKEMKVWDAKDYNVKQFNAFFICYGKIYIRHKEKGLIQMENGTLKPIPGGETFASKKIYMMVPYDNNVSTKKMLIGTYENGFYIYDDNTITPLPTNVDDYIKKKKLYHGVRLSSGDFALATLRGGVIIMDSQGFEKHKFIKAYGLQDEDVKYVFEDSQGNLWLGLNKGISKIEYGTPVSVYDDRSLITGIVLSVVKHHKDLYVGTTSGLYILTSPLKKFGIIHDISTNCYSLLSIGDSVLAATENGVFYVVNDKKRIRQIISTSSHVLLRSKKNINRIWVGTELGLVSLYREVENGQWSIEYKFKKIVKPIRTIVEDENGDLWLGISPNGILKVPFSYDNISLNVTPIPYGESNKLPSGEVYVFWAARCVMFGAGTGLYRFDEKKSVFIPDARFGEEFNGSRNFYHLAEDKNGNIWFHSRYRNFKAIPRPDGTFDLNKEPSLIHTVQVNAIYPDPDEDIIWFASDDGLIRYDTTKKKGEYKPNFFPLIRKVWVNENLRIDGYKMDIDKDWKDFFPPLPYEERNLRFEFAAPFFLGESVTQYQYFLEGYDEKWSEWTSETKRDYTNLDSGTYAFQVRAKNVYGELNRKAVFKFKILPPWYKAWWAFLLYAFFAFLMVYFIVKWRSWRLHQEKQRLEQVVKERTKEINQKSQQLEKQTAQLQEQSEKLKELDHVKSRFFANISHEFRTPLTLIMGPLEQMLTDDEEKEQDRKDRVKLMLRNSQRLLNLINQLLDLSKLDSGKMKLQVARQNIVPFLKGLMDSFQYLAAQNKLELTFQSEEEDITLYFDLEKLEKVVCNLLSNAIKFTPAGGKITIKVRNNPTPADNFPSGCAAISVAETGVGIPREQLEHIFDRFYQAGVSGEHEQKGSGIGLALTKELVTLHHGDIDVKSSDGSEGENSGTEFILRLPLGKELLKPEEIVDLSGIPSPQQKPCEVPRYYAVEKEEEEHDVKEKDFEPETQDREIILVVEDSRDVRKYIRGPLETHYTVVEAVNGREGIEKAREIIPDLIISDIMMPEADGYELCSVLKQDVLTSHIPIVLLTAKASEENVVQGLETGADDYITKPFNTKILMARIRNLIELRRQLQQKMKRQMMLQPVEISVSSIDEEFITELQGTIEKNLSDPEFTVEELGKKLYMSRASLYRKIQALTGESPNHFIRNYRLKRAAQLLKENFGNVTEIAFEVGFSSSAYFTKCFKEQFQQLPSSYQASESPGATH